MLAGMWPSCESCIEERLQDAVKWITHCKAASDEISSSNPTCNDVCTTIRLCIACLIWFGVETIVGENGGL